MLTDTPLCVVLPVILAARKQTQSFK